MKNWQGQEGLSSHCKLPPELALAISSVEHPCDCCNTDRTECQGFPRKDSGRAKSPRPLTLSLAASAKAAREARIANTVKRCTVCGLRRRGSNHDQGAHHQKVLRALQQRLR